MTAPKQYVASHPLSIVTSVSLSNDRRVFIGRPVELSAEDKKLLKAEFPHVDVKDAADAAADDSTSGSTSSDQTTTTGAGGASTGGAS